jgi:hypothetical protein
MIYIFLANINNTTSLQEFIPLSEAEIQTILRQTWVNLDMFLRGVSLSSCPQHRLNLLFLLNAILSFKVCAQLWTKFFHFSYLYPDYRRSILAATGLESDFTDLTVAGHHHVGSSFFLSPASYDGLRDTEAEQWTGSTSSSLRGHGLLW